MLQRGKPGKKYAVNNHLPPFPQLQQTNSTLLQGRYRVSTDRILGEGGFAKVYKGLDVHECKNVAVKMYKETNETSLAAFKVSVDVLLQIRNKAKRSGFANTKRVGDGFNATLDRTLDRASTLDRTLDSTLRSGSGSGFNVSTVSYRGALLTEHFKAGVDTTDTIGQSIFGQMDFTCCFVEILGYSKDFKGAPGLDAESETLFVVFELGEESLEDRLRCCEKHGKPLTVPELRSLHWALVSIVCGLHSHGFVHGDIKPCNIVRFQPKGEDAQWKLIDLDSAMKTGSKVHFSDLFFTKTYMPPELAESYLKASADPSDGRLCLSRLMDIWSVGMCAMEAIFLRPVLGPWYCEWKEETGDDVKFMTWLSDKSTEPIISGDMRDALAAIDEDMCDMMEGMLVKEPLDRSCIAACLTHRWFDPVRNEILDQIRDDMFPRNSIDDAEVTSVTDADFGATIRPCELENLSPPDFPAPLLVREDRGHITREQTKLIAKGVTTRACNVM